MKYIYRLILASLIVAIKYNEDDYIISAQDELEESEMIDDDTNYESNSNYNCNE